MVQPLAMNLLSEKNQGKPAGAKKSIDKGADSLHQQAFDHSLQANIIFIVADGKIIRANRAACQLLGYSKKELLTKYRKDIFSLPEKSFKRMMKERNAEGSAKADLSLVRKSGKLLPCEITSVIFKDANGVENSILSIVDLRERQAKQKIIDADNERKEAETIAVARKESDTRHEAEDNVWMSSVASTSYDLIWDWNIPSGLISFGNNFDKVFGYELNKNKIGFREWMVLFAPEEGAIIEKKLNTILTVEKDSWEDVYQFTYPGGPVVQVTSRANLIRDEEGKLMRVIGVIHDISRLRKLEKTLELEIRIKEREIIEAIVEAKESERSDIGKELHDNINQLLGASMLYLEMARKDIKNGEVYLIHSSEYTLAAIEEIRKLTKGLTTATLMDFGLCGAIEHISLDIMEASSIKIHFKLDPTLEATMTEKFKLNTFRILQEQLNNIVKHAKATEIQIRLSRTKTGFMLSISDDGVGFDPGIKTKGIGISNIISRSALYKGTANFISEAGKGCKLVVNFPGLRANLN